MTDVTPLSKIEVIATGIIVNEFSPKLVFHTIKHIKKVVKTVKTIGKKEGLAEEEIELAQMAAWSNFLGLSDIDQYHKVDDPKNFYKQCVDSTIKRLDEIFSNNDLPKDLKAKIIHLIHAATPHYSEKLSKIDRVLRDAISVELASKKGPQKIKLLYEELLLTGAVNVGQKGWYDLALGYLLSHEYTTTYGKEKLTPQKEKNFLLIQKESKNLKKQHDFILQKEMDISDEELKDLKKKLKASKGRDDRGIQTMFRTTSKNHYTLNEMVDKKANIMISVNSIILSVIIGGLLNTTNIQSIGTVVPIFIMLVTGFISVIFAVLSIRPDTTHGKFTEKEIRNREGNLLFFGNFHGMDFRDYEWGVLEMISDQEYLYSTMIRDIYYLGQTLDKKYKHIRISLNVFMIGVALSAISFLVYRFCWFCF